MEGKGSSLKKPVYENLVQNQPFAEVPQNRCFLKLQKELAFCS